MRTALNVMLLSSMMLLTVVFCPAAFGSVNLLDTANGGRIISFTSQYNDDNWAAANLIDGRKTDAGWSSAEAVFPQEIVFAFKDEAEVEINRVSMLPFVKDIDVRWIRDFELLASTVSPTEGFVSLGKYSFELTRKQQDYFFKPTKVRYLMLRVLSNWGSNSYAELSKIGAWPVMESKDNLSDLINRLEELLADLKSYRDNH